MEIKVKKSSYALTPGSSISFQLQGVLKAPKKTDTTERSSVSIVLVIDKSGSMSSEGKLEYAKIAARSLVQQLDSTDYLGIIAYDSNVTTLAQIGRVTNKESFNAAINTLQPGSCTYLSGGLSAGIEMLRSHHSTGTRRVFLLSDGQANEGDTSIEGVNAIASRYRSEGITVSSIGLGRDFNEHMMKGIAEHGGGQYFYVDKAEILPGIFASELNLAQNTVTFNTTVWMEFNSCVTQVKIPGYTTTETTIAGAVMPIPIPGMGNKKKIDIKMGDFGSEEKRNIYVDLLINANSPNDSFLIGTIHASYSPSSNAPVEEHIATIDVIVTGDQARVLSENENTANSRAIQAVQKAKIDADADEARKQALIELERGRREEAERLMNEQSRIRTSFRVQSKAVSMTRQMHRQQQRLATPMVARPDLDAESESSDEEMFVAQAELDRNDQFDRQIVSHFGHASTDRSAQRNLTLAQQHFQIQNTQGLCSYQAQQQPNMSYF
ncbi:putative von Willebrand factor A [Blattamonas nauphoetae]|uniref:von Willebrand factor A n=1 Tax=Blattamonas nauphoetae TaxID=2049346 RepID=A0ABQ9XKN5_9EUKA|nr:putative von Willebrand factor A [Blattamonas nauphoetae]